MVSLESVLPSRVKEESRCFIDFLWLRRFHHTTRLGVVVPVVCQGFKINIVYTMMLSALLGGKTAAQQYEYLLYTKFLSCIFHSKSYGRNVDILCFFYYYVLGFWMTSRHVSSSLVFRTAPTAEPSSSGVCGTQSCADILQAYNSTGKSKQKRDTHRGEKLLGYEQRNNIK